MYIKPGLNGSKGVLVVKHLEDRFFQSLSDVEMELVRNSFCLGLYLGTFTRNINYKIYDFVVFADGVFPGFNGEVPRLPLSGFNFLPAFESVQIKEESCDVLYVGDLSENKNLIEFLYFSVRHPNLRLRAVIRFIYPFDRFLCSFIRFIFRNIEFNLPGKGGKVHSRGVVLSYISNARYLFVPYIKEGAARVFAEAEVLGKPIIYNPNMVGGTLSCMVPAENISMFEFKGLADLPEKDTSDKRGIYEAYFSSRKVEEFLMKEFAIRVSFGDGELVNAFSGHRNDLCRSFTNAFTDEIASSRAFSYFLRSIGCEKRVSTFDFALEVVLSKIKVLYGFINFYKFWIKFFIFAAFSKRT